MPVLIERLSSLQRRMTFDIPAERIYQAVQLRLRSLAAQVKVPGFRAGKIPVSVVESMLGEQVRQEVIREIILHTFSDIAAGENINPAGIQEIDWKVDGSVASDAVERLEFTATFEVEPEFTPAPVEQIRIEWPVVEIDEACVDQRLDQIRRQRAHWDEVQRPARVGDRVVVDLQGTSDDEGFLRVRKVPLILGGANSLPLLAGAIQEEITRKLVGAKVHQCLDLEGSCPDSQCDPDAAVQSPHFLVKVRSIAEPRLPELSTAFIRTLGIASGDLAELRRQLRDSLEREAQTAVQALIRRQVQDALLALNPIDVPIARIETESERLLRRVQRRMAEAGFEDADVEIASLLVLRQARDRVATELVLAKIAREAGIEPEPALGREEAALNSEDPFEGAWNDVLEWIVRRAQVEKTFVSFGQLMLRWKSAA